MLLPVFSELYEQARVDTTPRGTVRPRAAGGGRKGQLRSAGQKLLFIVVYQKAYPLQALLGEVFELSQSRVNHWVQYWLPLRQQTLEALEVRPERRPSPFALQAGGKRAAVELIIEGTDRRRQRPQSPERQALHDRGKHKAHSDKNVVVVHAKTTRVGYWSRTYAGKIQDKKIADQEALCYPRTTILDKDTGFPGYEPPGGQTRQPKKSRAKATSRRVRSGTTARWRASGRGSHMPWRG